LADSGIKVKMVF